MSKRPATGFTLIEVLLVIMLIGLLAATVVYSFSGESREQKLGKEIDKLQLRVQLAAELALLKQAELGLYLDETGYRFMLFEQDKWLTIREPKALAPHQFGPHIQMKLELEGLEWAEQNLLSQVPWQEDDTLSEENSFDQLKAEQEQLKAEQDAKDGKKSTKPKKRNTGILTQARQKTDPKLPQIFILSSGEISPFLLDLSENSDQPVWHQQLKAVFSVPLERSEITDGR